MQYQNEEFSIPYPSNTMADDATLVAHETANLHLDEMTGDMVSKSELKKRQKARDREAAKQQQRAPALTTTKKRSAEDDESNLTPNVRVYFPRGY